MDSQASMHGLVEFIAKSLVDDPSQVYVSEIEGENSVILELRVGPEDMGRSRLPAVGASGTDPGLGGARRPEHPGFGRAGEHDAR